MSSAGSELTRLSYPLPGAPRVVLPGSDEAVDPVAGVGPWPALPIQVPLWEDVVLHEQDTPVLGWWDSERGVWSTTGFSNVSISHSAILQFETTHFAPTAIFEVQLDF